MNNISAEKIFFIGLATVLSILIISITYYNVKENEILSKGMEECRINGKTIIVKDCSKVLREYHKIEE